MRLRSASPSLALAVLALPFFATRASQAQTAPPPAQRATVYSAYESQTIDQVLASLHETRDPAPDGKTIERVEIVPIEVFEARDDPFPAIAFPRVLNALHVTSRTSVIRRELLVHEGDTVRAGQPIAAMGVGPGQQPMLYFEIRMNGRPVDPRAQLPPRG